MAKVLLLEIQPRNVETGERQTVRFAGGGAHYGYHYDDQDWRAGLTIIPVVGAQLDFDGKNLALGAIPQALTLEWAPAGDAAINEMAALHWARAPFTLYLGEENEDGNLPGVLLSGKCMSHKITDSVLQLAMADPAVDLKRPIVVDTFAGTGGVEGPAEWKGRRKRRVWGQAFNIEGEPIDPPNNIYCFSDPSKPLQGFLQLRDKGVATVSATFLGWQGSVAATFTALQAAAAPSGGGVFCPSIGMVKWWTRPAGKLCADVQGEVGAGYTDTPAGIVRSILAARNGPTLVGGVEAAINLIRGIACGYVADDLDTEISAALDFILGGVSLLWVLEATTGQIRIEPWGFGAPVGAFQSDHAVRINTFPPLKARRVGYRRNHSVHSAGELAAIVTYGDGTPIDDLQGRIVTALRPDGSVQGQLWGGSDSVPIVDLLEGALTGKSLSLDPDFTKGAVPSTYAVYDNAGANRITLSIETDAAAPNGSGKVMKVSHAADPDAADPGFGGVVQQLVNGGSGVSRPGFYSPGTTLAFVVWAKIPAGRNIQHASNLTGDGGGWRWLTGNAGTGSWQRYIGLRTIGPTGTLSATGYFFIDAGANAAFDWYIASYDQRELSSAALPQLNRLIDATGGLRTDAELITGQGISLGFTGEGYLARQNYADWQTRIVGAGKPSDNAGTTLTMYDHHGDRYTIIGNTVVKKNTNDWDTSAWSREFQAGTAFVSAEIWPHSAMFGLAPVRNGGTYPSLSYAFYRTGATTCEIYEAGGYIGGYACTADSVFLIAYDGVRARYYIDGTLVRTVTSVPNMIFYVGVSIAASTAAVKSITFGPYTDRLWANVDGTGKPSNNAGTANMLTVFGDYTLLTGNVILKSGGAHGVIQGGVYGTAQRGTAFVSCRPIQGNTWGTHLGLDPVSATNLNTSAAGVWNIYFIAYSGSNCILQIYKAGVLVGSFDVGKPFSADDRMALIFNGRRVFAMFNGVVYGGDTSTYDVASGTVFWPKVWDFYDTTGGGNGGITDIQYGSWTDARSFRDDGFTVMNQADIRTLEGIASGITGQSEWATTPNPVAAVMGPHPNLVFNGGFKLGKAGWTDWRSDAGMAYFAYFSGTGEGPYLYTNTANGNTVVASSRPFAAWPGVNYTLQAVGAGGGITSGTFFVRITFLNASMVAVGYGSGLVFNSSWQAKKVMQMAPAGTAYGIIEIVGEALTLSGGECDIRRIKVHNAGDIFTTFTDEATFAAMYDDLTPIQSLKPGEAGANVTGSHISLGFSGQGALSLLNVIDLATGYILPRGSIPPMFANNGFTYTSTTTTINFTWPSMTIYRPDGTTISIASGSQNVTSLGSNTTYRVYPYIVDDGSSSATIQFVTSGGSPVYGAPAILYASGGNVPAAAQSYLQGRIPMGQFNAATTVSGGGGGGGGGWNCIHEDMLVQNGRAGDLAVGDTVETPSGIATVERIEHHSCGRWIEVWDGPDMLAKVTERHLFYRATDGSEVMAKDLQLGDMLKGADAHLHVTGLRLCTIPATAVGIGLAAPHLHYLGQRRVLCHNGTAKP